MSRPSRTSRLALAGTLLALAVPAAATAQSGEPVDPVTQAYAATYQDGCTALGKAAARTDRKLTAIGRSAKTGRGYVRSSRRVLYPYLADFKEVADQLAAATAPSEFGAFQADLEARVVKLGPELRRFKRAASRARSAKTFNRVVRRLNNADLGGGQGLPDELVKLAPACGPLLG